MWLFVVVTTMYPFRESTITTLCGLLWRRLTLETSAQNRVSVWRLLLCCYTHVCENGKMVSLLVDAHYCIVMSAIYRYIYIYIYIYICTHSIYTSLCHTANSIGRYLDRLGYLGIFSSVALFISVPQCNDKTWGTYLYSRSKTVYLASWSFSILVSARG